MNLISHDSETPAINQQVVTVCAFIHHNFDGIEKVFLAKRADTKKFLPGVYEIPGGHVDFGEDAKVALKREITEEFEMGIEVGDIFYEFSYSNQVKGSHSFELIYFAQFIGDLDQIRIHPEDHSEYGWFAENDLAKATTPDKGLDDVEFVAIQKAFALLRGEKIKF